MTMVDLCEPVASIFERELKAILQADSGAIERLCRVLPPENAVRLKKIERRPFLVIRAAGSFGVDLVAVRSDISFPIEVKTSGSDTIRFSQSNGRAQKQAEGMMAECQRVGLLPLYAFRKKRVRGDGWRMFTLPMNSMKGYSSLEKLQSD